MGNYLKENKQCMVNCKAYLKIRLIYWKLQNNACTEIGWVILRPRIMWKIRRRIWIAKNYLQKLKEILRIVNISLKLITRRKVILPLEEWNKVIMTENNWTDSIKTDNCEWYWI